MIKFLWMDTRRIFRPALGSLVLATVLLSGCADEIAVPVAGRADGSLAFSAADGEDVTRAATLWQHVGSLDCSEAGSPFWLHVSSANNSTAVARTTRSCPTHTCDLQSFHVTATVGRENNDEQIFILDRKASVEGNLWLTEETYYWPQEEVTFYAIGDNALGMTAADISPAAGKSGFRYVVPKGRGDSNCRDAEAQPDIVLATTTARKPDSGIAHLQFRHPLAGVYVTADETVMEAGLESITLSGLYGSGTLTFDGALEYTPCSWKLDGEPTAEYTQKTDDNAKAMFEVNGASIEALAPPFMLLPHTSNQMQQAKLTIMLSTGEVREVSLASIFRQGWQAGRIYRIHLSRLDALYPPVRDLQGMAGNNTVSLSWLYPDPNDILPHVHQIGVYIEVDQFATAGEADGVQGPTVSTKLYWNGAEESGIYPEDWKNLDLIAEVTKGIGTDGNPLHIDTRLYDRFKVRVYAAYINESDPQPVAGEAHEIHLSVAARLTIDRVRSNAVVAFYMPEGTEWEEDKDPVDCLPDDDDKAAADWFRRNFAKGVFVNKKNFREMKKKYGFKAVWFPCGVKLNGEKQKDQQEGWDHYWTSKASYILTTMDLRDTSVEFMRQYLLEPMLLPNYPDFRGDMTEGPDWHKKTYEEIFKNYNAGGICHWRNLYNDGGICSLGNDALYLSEADCSTIRDFFQSGGNLLLTTFAIEKVADFGVCGRVPGTSMFNEVKQPAVWFVNPLANGSHPIYNGLFKVVPETFRTVYLSDFFNGKPDGDYKLGHVGEPYSNEAYFLAGRLGIPMFPLLSNHARACENNNVVWDCGKDKENIKAEHAKVLGTWGQLDTDAIGCVVEFEPYEARKGRCICIGLGAYEFNNGTVYDPTQEVMNAYQSNVHLLTRNALEYLITEQE